MRRSQTYSNPVGQHPRKIAQVPVTWSMSVCVFVCLPGTCQTGCHDWDIAITHANVFMCARARARVCINMHTYTGTDTLSMWTYMQVDCIQCIQFDIATAPAKSFGEKLMGLRRKRSPARVQPSASAKTLPRAGSWQV